MVTLNFDKLSDKILSVDDTMRYIGIVDEKGNTIYSKMKEGKKSLKSREEENKFSAEMHITRQMQQVFDDSLGKITLTHMTRAKLHQLVYYEGNLIIYVTCERNVDSHKIAEISEKIEKIIKNS